MFAESGAFCIARGFRQTFRLSPLRGSVELPTRGFSVV
jgi:hypothetical protein